MSEKINVRFGTIQAVRFHLGYGGFVFENVVHKWFNWIETIKSIRSNILPAENKN